MAVFRERHHHRCDAFAALLICFANAKLFAGQFHCGLKNIDLIIVIMPRSKLHCGPPLHARNQPSKIHTFPTPPSNLLRGWYVSSTQKFRLGFIIKQTRLWISPSFLGARLPFSECFQTLCQRRWYSDQIFFKYFFGGADEPVSQTQQSNQYPPSRFLLPFSDSSCSGVYSESNPPRWAAVPQSKKSYILVGHVLRRECINRTLRRVDAGHSPSTWPGIRMSVKIRSTSM
jgi:hypothetical protein